MDSFTKCRSIDVLLFDGMNVLDLAGPVEAFDHVRVGGKRAYQSRFVSVDGAPVRAFCGLKLMPDAKLSLSSAADDLLLSGGLGVDQLLSNEKLCTVISQWQRKRPSGRLISVCSGSLLLASAGVLDGREATSHWSREEMAHERYPAVRWNMDKIFILSDPIYTSAGVSTGIDLSLAIIRQDCGAKAALKVAQELVVYLKRSGGQSQFSAFLSGQFNLDENLSQLVDQIFQTPERDWKLGTMADELSMNSRTLSRRFASAMGVSPVQFVEKVRVDLARQFLSSGMPLKRVAIASGFGDIQRMRRSFQRQVGVNLEEYLVRFGPLAV